jgi:hypothetical protein
MDYYRDEPFHAGIVLSVNTQKGEQIRLKTLYQTNLEEKMFPLCGLE